VRRRLPETLAAAAFDSPLLSPSRRCGAIQGLRQEVSFTPVPLVVEFVHRRTRKSPPEFPSRAAASSGPSAASPPQPLSPLASPPCALHVDASRVSNHVLEPEIEFAGEIAAQRRRSPLVVGFAPPPAACKRSWPPDRDLTHLVQPAAPLNPHASSTARSRSNGSRSSQPGQTQQTLAFLQKTPYVFRYSQKYPSTLGDSLRFSPFSFILAQFFFKPLQFSPCTFFRP
jgi:hypothetical protein